MQKKIKKTKKKEKNKICGGIADYLSVDPTMIRLIAVVLIACTGFFPLTIIYLVAAVIMPDYQEPSKHDDAVDGEFKEK